MTMSEIGCDSDSFSSRWNSNREQGFGEFLNGARYLGRLSAGVVAESLWFGTFDEELVAAVMSARRRLSINIAERSPHDTVRTHEEDCRGVEVRLFVCICICSSYPHSLHQAPLPKYTRQKKLNNKHNPEKHGYIIHVQSNQKRPAHRRSLLTKCQRRPDQQSRDRWLC